MPNMLSYNISFLQLKIQFLTKRVCFVRIIIICLAQELFEEASKYPLHWALQDRSTYVFLSINHVSERESLFDESKRLLDVNPFFSILRLEERKSEKPDEQLQNTIRKLIGKGKGNNTVHHILKRGISSKDKNK